MKIFIDRATNEAGIYSVKYGIEEDCPIAFIERNFYGRWSGEIIINLKNISEIDKLITLHLPTLKGTVLTIKHPLVLDNKDMLRLWFARMKYKRDEVELVEFGRRFFEEGANEYYIEECFKTQPRF